MPPRTAKEWKQFILIHFPILGWLWSYQLKFLINDIISGVTVSVMHIPQGQCMYILRAQNIDLPWHHFIWPISVYGWTQFSLVGQIYCTFSMRESLTICNNITISNKWPANFKRLFWSLYSERAVYNDNYFKNESVSIVIHTSTCVLYLIYCSTFTIYRNGLRCSGRVTTSVWIVYFIYGATDLCCVWNIKTCVIRYVISDTLWLC